MRLLQRWWLSQLVYSERMCRYDNKMYEAHDMCEMNQHLQHSTAIFVGTVHSQTRSSGIQATTPHSSRSGAAARGLRVQTAGVFVIGYRSLTFSKNTDSTLFRALFAYCSFYQFGRRSVQDKQWPLKKIDIRDSQLKRPFRGLLQWPGTSALMKSHT